jgi:5-methylcytosine-specific restriction enzyme A
MPNRPPTHKPFRAANVSVHKPAAAQRLSAHKRGYGSRWRKFRLYFLANHPLCECGPECCPNGCHAAATEVDHIQPIKDKDDPLFFEESNLAALSEGCHSKKTAKDRRKGQCRH